MTPRIRCENDAGLETCLGGRPVPSGGTIFSPTEAAQAKLKTSPEQRHSIQFPDDGYFRQTQRMRHLRFAQARRVVFKRQFGLGVIELELTQAVGVGEFAEFAQLLGSQRRLQRIADFQERHGGSIAGLSSRNGEPL